MNSDATQDVESLLPCYTLSRMANKVGCTEEELLLLAANGKLFLSVIADDWRIEGGFYRDGDGETEIIQSDEVVTGLVLAPILAKDILRISRGGSVQIEYLERSESSYARIIKAENQDFPIIGMKELVIGCADANAFLRKLHAQKQQDAKKPPAALTAAQDVTGKNVKNKLRRNHLDPAIDKAIKQAGNNALADVYLQLKELALAGLLPFTGVIDGDALCYTDSEDKLKKLSKNALGKRLKSRAK